MNERRKIEDRIRKKESEIQELNEKAREASIYLQALQDVLKMLPKDDASTGQAAVGLRPGSAVAVARDLILRAQKPMHISELLKGMGKENNRDNSASLGGSLAAYVRKGEIFSRPAPNIFWLLELGDPPPRSSNRPPAGFGVDDELPPDNDDDDMPF